MNIVTSANSDFFHCLSGLVESVWEHYGRRPIVYDVGLTDQDKAGLDAEIISIDVAKDCFEYASDGDSRFIKTTHKPACIRHYWEHHHEPMIFLDADCLFMTRVEETGFDVGVTLRTGKALDPADPFNGVINAGVLFFNTPGDTLTNAWANASRQENTTDQKALTDVLSETIDWQHYNRIYDWHGLKIKVFKTDEYNDSHFKSGKIFHFKGLRHDKAIYQQLLTAHRTGADIYRAYRKLRRKKRSLNQPPLTRWLTRIFGAGPR